MRQNKAQEEKVEEEVSLRHYGCRFSHKGELIKDENI